MDTATLLPIIFSGILAVTVFLYIIFDGYDLGVGLLFPFMKKREDRDQMVATVDPFWDANETWIVLGIGVIFIAFPKAYGEILVALYIPTITMIIGLILRGTAFIFRHAAQEHRQAMWDRLFCAGAYLATFSQGIMIGLYATGLNNTPANWAFAICIGVALCFGYIILGSAWLILKSEGHIRLFAIKAIKHSIFLAFLAIILVSLAMPYTSAIIFNKWFNTPNIYYLAPIPLLCLLFAFIIFKNLKFIENDTTHKRDWIPYLFSVLIVLCTFIGFGYSLYPYIIIDKLNIWEASAAPKSLEFVLWGVAIVLPIILIYTAYVHKVFSGKMIHDEEAGY